MAVDTALKRFSMVEFGTPSTDLLQVPSGSVDDEERFLLLDLYASPVPDSGPGAGTKAQRLLLVGVGG